MTSKLVLDLTDPDVADACGTCKVGEDRTFTSVTGTCTAKDSKSITFEVSDMEYSDPEAETPEEDAAEPADAETTESAVPPMMKPKKKAIAAASKY